MFKLMYYFKPAVPTLIFQNSELAPCLKYIRDNNYHTQRCMIISPNNRPITFNSNHDLVFGSMLKQI